MSAYVHFIRPRDVKSPAMQAIGVVRVREALDADDVSAASVVEGEVVVVVNAGVAPILVAFGSTPDAAAAAEGAATGAGFLVMPGATSIPFMPSAGMRASVKAAS